MPRFDDRDDAGEVNGSVMVVGGGIAGMQAALDAANSGYFVSPGGKISRHRRCHGPVGQDLSHQ